MKTQLILSRIQVQKDYKPLFNRPFLLRYLFETNWPTGQPTSHLKPNYPYLHSLFSV